MKRILAAVEFTDATAAVVATAAVRPGRFERFPIFLFPNG